MKPLKYTIISELRDNKSGFIVCIEFRDQLIPIPNLWFYNRFVAEMKIKKLQREDLEALRRRNRNPNIEYDADGKPL